MDNVTDNIMIMIFQVNYTQSRSCVVCHAQSSPDDGCCAVQHRIVTSITECVSMVCVGGVSWNL